MSKRTCRRLAEADARRMMISLGIGLLVLSLVVPGRGQSQTPSPIYKQMGAVVSIEPTGFTLQTDSGKRLTVLLSDNVTLVRVAPNEKDLKNATKIKAADISMGDRILVRGHISDDQKTLLATAAIVMSKADITRKQEAERADWQRRGVGGLVSSVDPATSTITISTAAAGGTKKVVIHVTKDTVVRRYAPDSVKFDDAKPGTLEEIKPGDQLRARGTRNEDGSEFTAEGIVSGSFRNIAGTISSIDASQNTISVTDLKTKKPVMVKFSPDSQLRKLPPMMAQMIATRLKGGEGGGPPSSGGPPSGTGSGGGARPAAPPAGAPPAGGPPMGGGPGGQRPGGAPDLQRILARMPPATLADLQKGDAVMIVATEGTASGGVTAITLLSGVEAILTSSASSASQAMFMSPWNLGGGAPGGEESAQ